MSTSTLIDNSSNMVDLSGGVNQNPVGNTTPYTGYYYAFYGEGGYTMDQCFNTIKLAKQNPLLRYDVTKALQVRYDVRTFNRKLGLLKDDNNVYVTESSFNVVTDRFPIDSITISATDFVEGMREDYVISVGTYSTLYSDFIQYVNTYFGYAGGFSSLFSAASEFDINAGVFDASSLLRLINEIPSPPGTDASGANVKPLDGAITITDINNLLKYAIDGNPFANRTTQQSTGTSSDAGTDASGTTLASTLYKSNYGMSDGFVAGDLIFIPAGTTIKLHLVIDSENLNPLNNLGPSNVNSLIQGQDSSRTYTTTYYDANNVLQTYTVFTENSTATTTNIDRTLTAPLLIKLDNLSSTEGVYSVGY